VDLLKKSALFGAIILTVLIFWSGLKNLKPVSESVQSGLQPAPISSSSVEGISINPKIASPSASLMPIISASPIQKPTSTPVAQNNDGLNNNNYYVNSQGDTVHSPAYSNSVPPGATAICGDGTYSFSQSRRGTCSHHGGVSQWL
jgi:hypothetical protein